MVVSIDALLVAGALLIVAIAIFGLWTTNRNKPETVSA